MSNFRMTVDVLNHQAIKQQIKFNMAKCEVTVDEK